LAPASLGFRLNALPCHTFLFASTMLGFDAAGKEQSHHEDADGQYEASHLSFLLLNLVVLP
jgi:hypothetical protein